MPNEVDITTGGVVRQTNPTPQLDGQAAKPSFDDLGRQVMTLHQVRDLVGTAAVTMTNNAADNVTTLIGGASGVYHDLVYVTGANSLGQ